MSTDIEFDFFTITDFDSHIEKSIPGHSQLVNNIESLSTHFLTKHSKYLDVGTSTGKLPSIINNKINCECYGIDNSENLINQGKYENVIYINDDIYEYDFTNEYDMITVLFTLQFLSIADRSRILKNLYDSLSSHGALIIAEKFYCKTAKLQDVFTFSYYDFKKINFTADEILKKEYDIRNKMNLVTVDTLMNELIEIGFNIKNIECFWTNYQFSAFIAIKE